AGPTAAYGRRAEAHRGSFGNVGDRRVSPADHAGGPGGGPRRPLRRSITAPDGAWPGANRRPRRLARPPGAVRDDQEILAGVRAARLARFAAGGFAGVGPGGEVRPLQSPCRGGDSTPGRVRALRLHPFDEHAGRLRPHDPRVGEFALAELLAQLAAADGDLLVPFRGALLDQPDAAELLVKRREAD